MKTLSTPLCHRLGIEPPLFKPRESANQEREDQAALAGMAAPRPVAV